MAAKDRAFFALLLRIYVKLDARLTCAVFFSGDAVCFQRRLVRHSANDVAYAQMPGCPLCSIVRSLVCKYTVGPHYYGHRQE